MKKRKYDWCFFSDGHREKILNHYRPISNNEEIVFFTRSGQYKYHSFIGEIVQGVGRNQNKLPTKYSQMIGTYFSKYQRQAKLSMEYGLEIEENYTPIYTIERIELRREDNGVKIR